MPGTLLAGELIASGDVNAVRAAIIAAVVGTAACFWPQTQLSIENGVLHGPKPWGLGRTRMALTDVDRKGSRIRRSGGVIRSVRGEAIWVDAIAIPAGSRRRILDALGVSGADR